MRIKDYTDTIRHLTDPFNIPEARRMIQENPALSREQFAEGQLVQPGPGRQGYAGDEAALKKHLKNYKGKIINKSAVAKQFGYKDKAAVERLLKELGKTELLKSPHPLHGPSRKVIAELQSLPDGSAIKLYELADKLDVDPDAVKTALKKPEIIKKNITTTSYGPDFLDNKKFKELYKDFKGTDKQFAEHINTQTKYKSATGGPFSTRSIETRRSKLNLKSKNPNPFMVEGISNKQVLSEAKRLGVETKGVSLKELRRKTAQRRGDEAHLIKMKTDPEYVERYRKYKEASDARIKADPELLEKKKEQQRAWARKNRPYGGIHHTKSPQGYLWRDLMDNATRYQYGRLPESHIKFKNPNQKFPTSAPKTEAVELIDTNVLDKKGKPKVITYDNVLEHINDNQRRYGMSSKDILNEYEKKIFIQQNPELRDHLNRKMYKAYDPSSPRQRAVFSPGHIHHTAGRGQNAFNVQFAPGTANLRENALRTKFKKDWQVAKTLSDKKAVTRRYLDAVPEDIEVRLKKVPYGTRLPFMEQIKKMGGKGFKMTPEVKAQVKTIVEKIGCPGLAGGGRVGFADGKNCFNKGLTNINNKNFKTEGQAKNMLKLAEAGSKSKALRGMLGVWGLGGEAIIEAGIGAYKVLGKGVPANIAWSESYWSYLDPRKYKGELSNLRQKDLEKGNPRIAKYFDAVDILEKRDYHEKWINQMNPDDPTHESHRNKLSQYDEIINNFYGGPSGITKMMERVGPEVENAEAEQAGKWAGEAGIKYKEPPSQVLKTRDYVSPRYKEMEEKFPTYTREQLDERLESWGANTPWNLGFESGVKGYDQMGEWLKMHDKFKNMEAGVANRATGGIASLKK